MSELLSKLLNSKDYERLLPVIEYLESNDSISQNKAESHIQKSPATARRYMGILVEAGLLKLQGRANKTIYVKTHL